MRRRADVFVGDSGDAHQDGADGDRRRLSTTGDEPQVFLRRSWFAPADAVLSHRRAHGAWPKTIPAVVLRSRWTGAEGGSRVVSLVRAEHVRWACYPISPVCEQVSRSLRQQA
jgi:hypothetical protein